MLKKLLIKNFQKHKNLLLEFDPHITTIVGHSHSGKTAIFRAWKVLTQNAPRGSLAYIQHHAEKFFLQATFGNKIITRRRTRDGKVNQYYIGNKGFNALGSQVPEEIEQHFNLHACSLQAQHDQPFWLFDPPATVAKNLNEIINLEVIDRVIDLSAKSLRSSKSELHIVEDRLQEIRAKQAAFSWIIACEKEYNVLEEWRVYRAELERRELYLKRLRNTIIDFEKFRRTKKIALQEAKLVIAIGEQYQQVYKKEIKLQTIQKRLKELVAKKKEIPNITTLLAIREKGDEVARACDVIEVLVLRLRELLERQRSVRQELQEHREMLAKAPKPKRCPTCRQIIPTT